MATIVGSGEFKYEVAPSWPNLPKYWSFGLASDAAVNSENEIYVLSRGLHPLTIWDKDGNFISSWGEGTFSSDPHGIFIGPDDYVWIADRNYHTVTEYTPGGEVVMTLGQKLAPSPTFSGMPFNMPSGVALAPDGSIFVSDGYGNFRVHKFSPSGELLHSWGRSGDRPGEFCLVHNIWVDRNGRVLVCDRHNDRIQTFNEDGGFTGQWVDLHLPGDLWIKDDIVYVVEQGGSTGVSIWTLDGEPITRWRGDDGPGKGTLAAGHGICVDDEGSIYVTEIGDAQRVTKFQKV